MCPQVQKASIRLNHRPMIFRNMQSTSTANSENFLISFRSNYQRSTMVVWVSRDTMIPNPKRLQETIEPECQFPADESRFGSWGYGCGHQMRRMPSVNAPTIAFDHMCRRMSLPESPHSTRLQGLSGPYDELCIYPTPNMINFGVLQYFFARKSLDYTVWALNLW
jgi:hypothetical protein